MPTVPASMTAVLAAGQVAPVVTVDYFGGTKLGGVRPGPLFVLFGSQERTEAEYARLFERAGLEYRGSTATESLHLFEALAPQR